MTRQPDADRGDRPNRSETRPTPRFSDRLEEAGGEPDRADAERPHAEIGEPKRPEHAEHAEEQCRQQDEPDREQPRLSRSAAQSIVRGWGSPGVTPA